MCRMLCTGEEEEDQEEGMFVDNCNFHLTVQNVLYRRGGGGSGGGNVR
jgi:hypothetical protein